MNETSRSVGAEYFIERLLLTNISFLRNEKNINESLDVARKVTRSSACGKT